MTDAADPSASSGPEHADLVLPPDASVTPVEAEEEQGDAVTSPAKVMRIGSMVKMLLEEVRAAPLDEPSRERLAEIYERSVAELADALSPDLQHELKMLALPFRDGEVPTEGEIRVAKAQLVGWLEGLFHGIQATLFAQQLVARQQLEQIRQLPPGAQPGPGLPGAAGGPQYPPQPERPGTYL
jgi:proteasome activator-like protein